MSYESIAADLESLYYTPTMNRYAIQYHDRQGNGWTRLVECEDVRAAVNIGRCDPDIVRIKSILPISNHLNSADL